MHLIRNELAGKHLRRFQRKEDGSLIVFSLFLFVTMLMVAGMAVDLMRYESNRVRLQSTLDRAVLAAASLDQSLSPEAVVLDYFDRAELGAYIESDNIVATNTLTARQVSAQAGIDMPTTFMRLLGIDNLTAPAAGTAEESASRTEVSLVLDVSGSMNGWTSGGRKISVLRDAATQFVNILMCNPAAPDATTNCTVEADTVSMSVIPYNQQVQATPEIFDQLNVTQEHTQSYCITFDDLDFSTAAMDPTYLFKRTGHFDNYPYYYYGAEADSFECQVFSSGKPWAVLRKILPMENEPQDLRDMIDDLWAGGNTSIDLGMKWGTAFLDPAFQPVVQGLINDGVVDQAFDDRPFLYTENGIKKVIVLMTDGVNTSQYYLHNDKRSGPSGIYYNTMDEDDTDYYSIYRASTDSYYWNYDDDWHDHPFGEGQYRVCSGSRWWRHCWWESEPGDAVELTFPQLWAKLPWGFYEQYWWLGDAGDRYGNSDKNTKLAEICTAAKDQNITVYTIGFEVTSSSASIMQACASSPAHYFDVDGADLSDAFAAIARQISALRLIN